MKKSFKALIRSLQNLEKNWNYENKSTKCAVDGSRKEDTMIYCYEVIKGSIVNGSRADRILLEVMEE